MKSLVVIVLAAWLSACSTLGLKPEEPTVTVSGVRPIELGLLRQELAVTLLIENPNAFELPVRSLDFVATLGGETLAEGDSSDAVVVPANGEAELEVRLVSGLRRTLSRLGRALGRGQLSLDYEVSGSVALNNWPTRIPFDVTGSLIEDDETTTR